MRKKTLLIFFTMFLCCVCVACIKSEMKKYTMPDGTRLKMSTTDEFYIGFSEETDELILYQDTYEETKIAYTIIDNEVALQYLEKNPFIRQDESNQETNPKYWFFIETLVYDEEIFKNRLHINGIDPENVLNMNLDLYEEE